MCVMFFPFTSEQDFKRVNNTLRRKLTKKVEERGGLILKDGSVIEFKNVAEVPKEGFLPEITVDLLAHLDNALATWHTHPGASANLSVEDWETFTQWPDHAHAIVGTDGVRWYRVERGVVINAS